MYYLCGKNLISIIIQYYGKNLWLKKESKFLCGSAFSSKGNRQLALLLDSEDYCTQAVIYTHPTRNGRAIGNATLNHIGLRLTDNCIRPVFFQLSSICFLGWTGWLEASQQNIHCVLQHPLPKNLSLPKARGCFLKACHWVGVRETCRWVGGSGRVACEHWEQPEKARF